MKNAQKTTLIASLDVVQVMRHVSLCEMLGKKQFFDDGPWTRHRRDQLNRKMVRGPGKN